MTGASLAPREARRLLLGAFRRALAEMDPGERVAAALPKIPRGTSVSVIAIGKAAPSMTRGALHRWGRLVEDALVVTSDGTDISAIASDRRVEVLRAAHPIPDRRSVDAADRCLARARACARDRQRVLLILVSGGASALVCAPVPGLSLRDKQEITRAMLASGASIQETNVVRRHLSRIKGGGLARAARPAPVLTLVVSDVVEGAVADIGSGPGVGDQSTIARARRLLRRYASRFESVPLSATGPARNVRFQRIVAGPEDLARATARELRARGLRARVLPPSQAAVVDLAAEYVELAKRLRPGTAVVRAAEPSLVVPARSGKGGRSTHLAALVGLELPPRATFLAAATDGVDGPSGTAGAIVDGSFLAAAGEHAIQRALERHDTGSLHQAMSTALRLRPSGQNLADLHVLLIR